jgi:ankyrin repeat protein
MLKVPGIDVNVMTSFGRTPLKEAIRLQRNTKNIRLLLELKADPNLFKHGTETPLQLALCARSPPVCHLLLRHGANIFFTTDINRNIIAWSALDMYTWYPNLRILQEVSQWDTGVCVLEQSQVVLETLLNYKKYSNHSEKGVKMLHALVTKMKNQVFSIVWKFLERATHVKALALSILGYI